MAGSRGQDTELTGSIKYAGHLNYVTDVSTLRANSVSRNIASITE